MKNPGLAVFSGPVMTEERPSINDDVDPDRREVEESSDFTPPAEFGRWRNPGHPIRVPFKLGPPYQPGESPHEVMFGELLTKEDQESADHILNGDHDSEHPSANPYVEHARQDLRTPAANETVHTLSNLLSGGSPEDVGGLDEAHDYLRRHFTGVRINPHHGTLLAQSPAGMQMAVRKRHLPAVTQAPEETQPPVFSLTNKHGTFESPDPKRIIRTMVAFQIVHNELELKRREKEDKDQNGGLAATSGIRDLWNDLGVKAKDAIYYLSPSSAPGYVPREPKPVPPRATPVSRIPRGSIFEPGAGTDVDENGVRGGWVTHDRHAPPHWERDHTGVAYSPGHEMNARLNATEARTPRGDPYFPGHTFTYVPNTATGHVIERHGGGARYFVNRLHPAARGGLDIPPTPKAVPAPPASRRPPRTSAARVNDLCPVCASGYLEEYDKDFHECLNCASLVKHIGFEKAAARDADGDPTGAELDDLFAEHDRLADKYDQHLRDHGTAHPDDLSGLPAGETRTTRYDRTPGGLVEHHWEDDLMFPYEAAKRPPRGGLGRGLNQIMEYSGDPLNLGTGGSENPENMPDEAPEEGYVHPLTGVEPDPDYVGYEAPKGRLLDKQAGQLEDDEIEEYMGKLGYQPMHSPSGRGYIIPDPHIDGSYYRLTEGVPTGPGGLRGWALTADHVPGNTGWTKNGDPVRHLPIERKTKDPTKTQVIRQPLPDTGNRPMSEKNILATGTHPIEDDNLNRAIRDVARHGRNSATYQNTFMDTAYEAPRPTVPSSGKTQRDLRMLSSVGNPGLTRFVG